MWEKRQYERREGKGKIENGVKDGGRSKEKKIRKGEKKEKARLRKIGVVIQREK